MTKKKIDTTAIINELEHSRLFAPRGKDSPGEGEDSSKDLDKDIFEDVKQERTEDTKIAANTLPNQDEVEVMLFRFRKEAKIRINADFPEAWKKELDEYAHQARVGKYHLVMYAVGKMLGKI